MIGQWTFQWLQENNFPVHYFPTTTSTNAIAKEASNTELHPNVFYVADAQSQGRGQGARTWINSKPGTNLLLTCSMKIHLPPQPDLCLAIGEKLHRVCLSQWPHLNWRVKPPNDLYLEGKKSAGVLLESVTQGSSHRLLVGLGFNVLDFPTDASFEATSLQKHLLEPISKEHWTQFLSGYIHSLSLG